jgi:cytochrome c oxidase subunit 4
MAESTHHPHEHHAASHSVGHIVPVRLLVGVGAALLILTVVTVLTAKYVDLGQLNIWVALIIAFVKASLVCLYFMHLRWDSPFNAIVLICSLLFVILFIGLSLTDTAQYQPAIRAYQATQPPAPPPAAP